MSDNKVVWTRYRWNLSGINVNLQQRSGYIFRSSSATELDSIIQVVLFAYGSDPIWKPHIAGIEKRMRERINATLGTQDSDCVVAEFEGKIVAASLIAKSHWTDQNLLTGICVAPEHQQKGLGTYLLALSLSRLHKMGLSHAQVYTEAGSLADRKIYMLFGSKRDEGVNYAGVRHEHI